MNIPMYDVIIIGGGVSGLMCANQLKNKKILVIEKNKLGTKLLITGGTRCNLTSNIDKQTFLNNIHNKKYMYSTINLFGPQEVIKYFEKINLKQEGLKIFPKSNKASDVLNYLNNVNYIYEDVVNIKENKVITLENEYQAKNIVVAIGGYTYKKTGCGDIYKFSQILKQPLTKLYPVEGNLNLKFPIIPGTAIQNVKVTAGKYQAIGDLMFTHKGLSGSSIMTLTEYIAKENIKEITVDFTASTKTKKLLKYLNNETIKKYEVTLCHLDKAFITGGGFDLKYINTKTFESKINPNIYIIGECLDTHGPIGGYNITLALSTAYSAAVDIKNKL